MNPEESQEMSQRLNMIIRDVLTLKITALDMSKRFDSLYTLLISKGLIRDEEFMYIMNRTSELDAPIERFKKDLEIFDQSIDLDNRVKNIVQELQTKINENKYELTKEDNEFIEALNSGTPLLDMENVIFKYEQQPRDKKFVEKKVVATPDPEISTTEAVDVDTTDLNIGFDDDAVDVTEETSEE